MEFAPAGRMSEGNAEGENHPREPRDTTRSSNRWLCLCAMVSPRWDFYSLFLRFTGGRKMISNGDITSIDNLSVTRFILYWWCHSVLKCVLHIYTRRKRGKHSALYYIILFNIFSILYIYIFNYYILFSNIMYRKVERIRRLSVSLSVVCWTLLSRNTKFFGNTKTEM